MNLKTKLLLLFINGIISLTTSMAQSNTIQISNQQKKVAITYSCAESKFAAEILYSFVEKSFPNTFEISNTKTSNNDTTIILEIEKKNKELKDQEFILKSNTLSISLLATNLKALKYAVYTLLEKWEFRKFSSTVTYVPKPISFSFPQNFYQKYSPSFTYRYLLYPDCYDESFREWHKLDWHQDDFGLWGHTFDRLVPPKDFFKKNPKLFALYNGKRRAESLCMTNDTVVKLVSDYLKKEIDQKPNAKFFSISQNDDVIHCECQKCKDLNSKHGGPQGALYHFLNVIAKKYPKIQISTLAYLHTFNPPTNLTIAPNITTIFCPIEMDRGLPISLENRNKSIANTLNRWGKTNKNVLVWDYTVQFSNYLSPFPNLSYCKENYTKFKKSNVKGVFVQGYADVPGDLSELRQYLLAKLLWDTNIDVQTTTADFLRGYYGKAANSIQEYLNLLSSNQKKSKAYLDIYSGPIQNRNTYLTPEAMDQYDQILEEALNAVTNDNLIKSRIEKLRLSLEYVYFEQSKFYGTDAHGLFVSDENGKKMVRNGLTERVLQFSQQCNKMGIYELSEGGISPNKYYEDWLVISKNTTQHLGEKMKINILTSPAPEYAGKGAQELMDGIKGYHDFNINWMGWYGTNPEIEINPNAIAFNTIKVTFLEDQRHWIFPPKALTILGLKNKHWETITTKKGEPIIENYDITPKTWEITNPNFRKYKKIKLVIQNQETVPSWRFRKNKKPMIMLDEIEVFLN
ncbi:protein of unknown function [Flavobacterium succinicans]|uniref:DUF4838 domain-containing protein n=1 Tax=Flavobacterium succinicans TaxID=29536 RepID=A0A1I4UD83_9FLAO|nr:DUF4838 domain-containing protein [Flavobacterium succinicans]SFM86801.1 protein of unknown function [Flavobacterium succinicans]